MKMWLLLVGLFGMILLLSSPVISSPVGTQGSQPCQFPFIYKEVSYSECTTIDDPDGNLWCSIKTDSKDNHIKDQFRTCTSDDVVTVRHSPSSPPECQFPFIYRNVKYSECITVGDPNLEPWCSTKTDSQHMHLKGNWMHCKTDPPKVITESTINEVPPEISKTCKFPFIYNDVSYTVCTVEKDPDSRLWCSTKTDSQNKHIKDNWKHCESADTQIPLQADDRQSTLSCWTYPDTESGDCVFIQECPSLRLLLQQIQSGSAPFDGINILRKSVCHEKGDSVRVCCPIPDHQISVNLVNTYSESQCGGAYNTDKIVNGVNAQLASWPWMVIFRGRECRNCEGTCKNCPEGGAEISTWSCGGVLISKLYVISAAHCFKNTQIFFARIGEFDLNKNPDIEGSKEAPQPQDIDVESVVIHPKYGHRFEGSTCPKCNDIAIVKLANPVVFNAQYVQPICLPTNPIRDMGYSASSFWGKVAYAAGWGATEKGRTHPATTLQQANLTIQNLNFCQERKAKHPSGSILCAGQGDGQDTCGGDSGGPLMIADSHGLKWYTVGIASYGATVCGAEDAQGIFTNMYYYMDWIKKIAV